MDDIQSHILPVYIRYESLTAKSVGVLLSCWGEISDIYSKAYCREFLIGEYPIPALEIDSVHTGKSIKFTFGEGLLPSISKDEENDIIIDVPKKIGIPLLIGYITLSATQQILDVRNKQLDNRLKQIEIKLKETELNKIRESANEEKQRVMSQTQHIVNQFIYNHNITSMEVYDVDIINIARKKDNDANRLE